MTHMDLPDSVSSARVAETIAHTVTQRHPGEVSVEGTRISESTAEKQLEAAWPRRAEAENARDRRWPV